MKTLTLGRRHRGISLITTLLFTVAALLLGVSVMGINVMQERMIGNSRDRDLAFQAAEAALRDAEFDIQQNIDNAVVFDDACFKGLCTTPSRRSGNGVLRALPVEQQQGFDWADAARTRRYGQFTNAKVSPKFPNVLAQPVYVIEKLGEMAVPPGDCSIVLPHDPECDRMAYRITARATGGRAETVVLLQSIYYRP